MTDRGQTVHDYLLGTVLVILTIGAAIGLLFGAYDPFFDPVDAEDENVANSISQYVIDEYGYGYGGQAVNITAIQETLDDDTIDRSVVPLGQTHQFNITVQDGDNIVHQVGQERSGAAETTSVRVITAPGTGDCSNNCLLIVRVW